MTISKKLAYLLLSYAPSPLSGKSVTIAVVLFDPASVATGLCRVHIGAHWKQRVLNVDPDADIDTLEALTSEIEYKLNLPASREMMLQVMEDSFSNALRVSDRKECLCLEPSQELERLVSLYL